MAYTPIGGKQTLDSESRTYLEEVCEKYNLTDSLKTKHCNYISHRASYTLTLISKCVYAKDLQAQQTKLDDEKGLLPGEFSEVSKHFRGSA